MGDLERERIRKVRVTNNLPFDFTDRYDGVPIRIEPGKSHDLNIEVAAHFFGWHVGADNATMFRYTSKRQGWNTAKFAEVQPSGMTLAEEQWSKIKVEPIEYKLVQVEPDPRKPIPADPDAGGEVEIIRRAPGRPPTKHQATDA